MLDPMIDPTVTTLGVAAGPDDELVLPDYGGACPTEIVPTLYHLDAFAERDGSRPSVASCAVCPGGARSC